MSEAVGRQPYLSEIRDIQLMRFLSEEEISEFLAFTEVVAYRKGEKIIHLGDVSPYFYGIVKGSVHVTLRELDDQGPQGPFVLPSALLVALGGAGLPKHPTGTTL